MALRLARLVPRDRAGADRLKPGAVAADRLHITGVFVALRAVNFNVAIFLTFTVVYPVVTYVNQP